MKKKLKALSGLKDGFNCAQAVSAAFCEELGADEETAAKMSSALGAGMSRTGGVCGAVSGALMVIGMKYGSSKPRDIAAKNKSYEAGRVFLKMFEDKYGSIFCPKLIGIDISTEAGLQAAREKKIFETICADIVQDTVGILEQMGVAGKTAE
jgi:C_GCAxxG_C_C family probable redox protein